MQIGERIAAYRKRRGMSQDALAGLVGMSRSWLSQVERGIHTVDRLSTLTDLAAVLRVDVADLVGREWRLAPNGGSHVQAIDAIGRQLADYSYLLGEQRQPWPLPQLRNAAVEIHRAYQAAHYDRAAAALPTVLAAADAYDGYGGRGSREVYLARCMVYAVAAKLLTKVGESHMAWLAADRATHAAMAADSLTAQGVAAYQVVCALLEDEQVDQAERTAISSADRLTGHAASDAPDTVSVAGALWLIASVIAARKADRSAAMSRLNTAEQLTGLIGHDANHAWTAFGPTNVRIHRSSCFAELGDPYAVLSVATEVDVNALPDGLNGRRSRMHLDLAWAQTQARNDMEAILHLQQAEQVAPEVLRYDRIARGSGARTAQTRAPSAPSVKHDGNTSRNHLVTDRILYLVTCGAPLASRTTDGITASRNRGWQPFVIPTDASRRWIDADALDAPVLSDHRASDQDERAPAPDAVAVVPATFNTLNAWANGTANTYPLVKLCAALGARIPTVAVPFAKHDLAGHPAWLASIAVLRYAGVRVIDPKSGAVGYAEPVESGTGEAVTAAFSWAWVLDQLPTT